MKKLFSDVVVSFEDNLCIINIGDKRYGSKLENNESEELDYSLLKFKAHKKGLEVF